MYKLVAIDLDGTLLDSTGAISEKNKNAIKKTLDRNIEVVLASRKNNRCFKSVFKRTWN